MKLLPLYRCCHCCRSSLHAVVGIPFRWCCVVLVPQRRLYDVFVTCFDDVHQDSWKCLSVRHFEIYCSSFPLLARSPRVYVPRVRQYQITEITKLLSALDRRRRGALIYLVETHLRSGRSICCGGHLCQCLVCDE